MITTILQIYFYLLLLLATGMTVGFFGHACYGAYNPNKQNHGGFIGLWICIIAIVLSLSPFIVPILLGYITGKVMR